MIGFRLSRICHLHRGGQTTRLHRPPYARIAYRTPGVHRIFTHVRDDGDPPLMSGEVRYC
jgi:hypothetical protein